MTCCEEMTASMTPDGGNESDIHVWRRRRVYVCGGQHGGMWRSGVKMKMAKVKRNIGIIV